jgi:ribosomal protein L37AE/L43A
MKSKTCPYCGKTSYSAAEHGIWICPYQDCGEDITEVEFDEIPAHD